MPQTVLVYLEPVKNASDLSLLKVDPPLLRDLLDSHWSGPLSSSVERHVDAQDHT